MTTPSHIPLPRLPRELAQHTGRPPPSYRSCYNMVLNGEVPAEQENGRWLVRRDDLSVIAAALGLTDSDQLTA